MKIIYYISDIEFLKADLPLSLRTEMEKNFIELYEALNHEETYLVDFFLPVTQALIVLEKGDDVRAALTESFLLESIDLINAVGVNYYRCTVRKENGLHYYYSIAHTHDRETEEWLHEHAALNERAGSVRCLNQVNPTI